MVQELIDLRQSIVEGRYQDALAIIDELEGMGKQAILRNIESFLVGLLIHLIKNQLEKRLTNSWAASISDSIVQIKKLNLKDNKKSYYIKQDQWLPYIEEAIEIAIRPVSIELFSGSLKPSQISKQINRDELTNISQELINLIYEYPVKNLPDEIDHVLVELPGGAEWIS
ncbi:MAG: DUF29 family protein [Xenococcaceae cyanobacterium MO_167.B52]|nr:DUF29 family protein [Xenococcaceae cyanobacterium MO_167.B52]